jgi:hypothetical protein
MPKPRTPAEMARRVDDALRTERDNLRTTSRRENVVLANHLNDFVVNADENTKARLYMLITGNETRAEAISEIRRVSGGADALAEEFRSDRILS